MNTKIKFKQLSGFTLVELLTGLVIGFSVISLTGFSLIQMLRLEKSTTDLSQQSTTFNIATDYLANRIRIAEKVDAPSEIDFSPYLFTREELLVSLNGEKEIYYITAPADDSVWLGPKVIMRWTDGEGSTVFLDQLNKAQVNDEDCHDSSQVCTISLESYLEEEPEPYRFSLDVAPRI